MCTMETMVDITVIDDIITYMNKPFWIKLVFHFKL